MAGDNFWILWGGDTAVMRGDIELMGGPPVPPTRENLGACKFYLISHIMI